MATGGGSVKAKRVKGLALLTSAACEWFLIFLLLLDAMLSYLLTKFASYCQLQLPCLLCTRLDRILGGDKQELYQNLFCSNHKSEISSLVLCHVHEKVADGNRMCDDCLLSFTTSTKANMKTHRLLVGKFGVVLGGSGSQSLSLSRDLFTCSKGSRSCACCGKLWKSEQNAPRSIQLKSPGRAVLKPYIPLPHVPRQSRLNHRDNMKKIRDKISGSEGNSSFHPLSHVGYTELKLTSDSESEFPFSDDDDVASVFHEDIEASNDPGHQFKPVVPPRHVLNDLNPEKPNSSSPKGMPLNSDRCVEPKISKHHDVKYLGSDSDNECSPEEINLQPPSQSSSDLPELISLDEVSLPPIAVNIPSGSGESGDSKTASCLSQNSLPASLSELMTLDGTRGLVAASSDKSVDVTQASGTELVSREHKEVVEKIGTTENASAETDQMVSDSAPVSPRQENSSNMSKSPVSPKESEVPGFVIEQPTTEGVNTVMEEMELSPSHNSSPQGSNMSSVVSINYVQSPERHDEASNSNGNKVLSKSASVESDLEYLDGSNVTEIEGGSIVDQLKRQIEYDKKCLDALLKELEEERNASAIAANEAMSMITRLQEEKAALQMEALQYLRMMEEQAEYDNDELDKVNDLLTEKEKDIQDLEAELEFYRSNWTDEPIVHSMHEEGRDSKQENVTIQNVGVHMDEPMDQNMHKDSSDSRGETVTVQKAGVDNITNTVNVSDSKLTKVSKVSDEDAAGGTSSLEFEEEKLYISQCLKSLEEKLEQFSGNGISSDMPTVRPEKLEAGKLDQQASSNGEEPQLDGQEETDLSVQKNINTSNANHTDKDGSAASDSDDYSLSNEDNHSTSVGPKTSVPRREVDLVALENEISDLNDRLEALEFDHDLLEHVINSLQNGDDGKQFIQDIAHQLRELRKIGIRSRWSRHIMNGGHAFFPGVGVVQ